VAFPASHSFWPRAFKRKSKEEQEGKEESKVQLKESKKDAGDESRIRWSIIGRRAESEVHPWRLPLIARHYDADDADDADDARSITGFRPLLCTARRITTSLACFVYARKT
jgi:hypothetical protein